MKKPTQKSITYLNWSDCITFLEKKYNFQHRDYANSSNLYHVTLQKACDLVGANIADLQENLSEMDKNDADVKRKRNVREAVYAKREEIKPPYLDFWHWMCDTFNCNNGTIITMDNSYLDFINDDDIHPENRKMLDPQYHGWKGKILEYILSEFGEGEDRVCSFQVSW